MKATTLTEQFRKLKEEHGAYLWGGSGQIIGDTTFQDVVNAEKTSDKSVTNQRNNAKKVMNFVASLASKGYDLKVARFFDCSGLVLYVLSMFRLFFGDATADSLYRLGEDVSIKNAKEGDLVFKGTASFKHHVGWLGRNGIVIECKGRDYGIVESDISEWDYASHYTWFEDLTLNRKLKVAKPYMTGNDVKNLQRSLRSHGISVAVDGVFGYDTKRAVTEFQKKAKLSVAKYGTVAKKTAEALGFTYSVK